jgi:hypothetical protein
VDAALQDIAAAVAEAGAPAGTRGPDGWGEQQLDHTQVWLARTLAVLRILLVECRCQLHLMQSNFAAARADVAVNIALQERFPVLLEGLRPALHMQAALYAHAVGAWGPAGAHYRAAAAAAAEPAVEAQARALAALARLAQGGPDAGEARRVARARGSVSCGSAGRTR